VRWVTSKGGGRSLAEVRLCRRDESLAGVFEVGLCWRDESLAEGLLGGAMLER
jgi:hypothetical protein